MNYIGKPIFRPFDYWQRNDPVLELNQMAFDTTNGNYRLGNGKSRWSQLPYILVTPANLKTEMAKVESKYAGLSGSKPTPTFIRTAADQTNLTTNKMLPFIDYFAMRDSLTTFPLPATAAEGDKFYVSGYGKGGWTITQNGNNLTGQIIHGAADTTKGGGSVSSGYRYDTLRLVCVVENTEFLIVSKQGNHIYA